MYAIRSYYVNPDSCILLEKAVPNRECRIPIIPLGRKVLVKCVLSRHLEQLRMQFTMQLARGSRIYVITSYSIHYTKLYDAASRLLARTALLFAARPYRHLFGATRRCSGGLCTAHRSRAYRHGAAALQTFTCKLCFRMEFFDCGDFSLVV